MNAPEFAVVAPTVPLMLIDAVPVRLVTVPLDGVPRAPPLTTNAPAVPALTPNAVVTPVPVVIVDGATPAPPPTTKALAASAADEAQPVADEKYGIPPDVPPTVKASVPAEVMGEPATEIRPPVNVCPTLVTVPAPLTVAHDVSVPLVVRYLPELVAWEGNNAFNAVFAVVCPVPPLVIASVPANVIVPEPVIGPPETVSPVVPPDTSTLVTVPVVGVDQVGTPAPALVNTWPTAPMAVKSYAVPVPYDTAPATGVTLELVPPFAALRTPAKVMVPDEVIGPPEVVNPVTPPETSTLDTVPAPAEVHDGTPAPLLVKTKPAVPAGVNLYAVPFP